MEGDRRRRAAASSRGGAPWHAPLHGKQSVSPPRKSTKRLPLPVVFPATRQPGDLPGLCRACPNAHVHYTAWRSSPGAPPATLPAGGCLVASRRTIHPSTRHRGSWLKTTPLPRIGKCVSVVIGKSCHSLRISLAAVACPVRPRQSPFAHGQFPPSPRHAAVR